MNTLANYALLNGNRGLDALAEGTRKERRQKEQEMARKFRQLQNNYIALENKYQEDIDRLHDKIEAELKDAISNDLSGTFYLIIIKAIRNITEAKGDKWGRTRIIQLLDEVAGYVNMVEHGEVTIERLAKEVEEDIGIKIEFNVGKRKFIESISFEKEE